MNWRITYLATVLAITGVGIYVPQWLITEPITWSFDMPTLEPQHLFIGLLILFGAGFIVSLIQLLRLGRDPKDWTVKVGIMVGILSVLGYMQERDAVLDKTFAAQERAAAAEAARKKTGWLPSRCKEIVVSLDDCGPKGPGLTDQVVFAIATDADCHHINHGCTRIAHRW